MGLNAIERSVEADDAASTYVMLRHCGVCDLKCQVTPTALFRTEVLVEGAGWEDG